MDEGTVGGTMLVVPVVEFIERWSEGRRERGG